MTTASRARRRRNERDSVEQADEACRAGVALSQLIRSLPPGHRLPSERELASSWGVGRALVRNAIRRQQHPGTVITRAQSGTFVSLPGEASTC